MGKITLEYAIDEAREYSNQFETTCYVLQKGNDVMTVVRGASARKLMGLDWQLKATFNEGRRLL